ncbi:MAG: DUF5686 family protein [Bacteroidota bacterium]
MSKHCYTSIFTLLVVFALTPANPLLAQDADTTSYEAERHVIESALGTMVKVIRTATFREGNSSVQSELHDLAARLNAVNQALPAVSLTAMARANTIEDAAQGDPDNPQPTSVSDLKSLENALLELSDQIRDIRRTLQAENEMDLAAQLAPVETGIDNAVVQTRRLIFADENEPAIAEAEVDRTSNDPWLKPGAYRNGRKVSTDEDRDIMVADIHDEVMDDVRSSIAEARDAVDEARYETSYTTYRYRQRRADSPFDDFDYSAAYVGEFFNRWPYRETALYRPIPAIRYNRVEGLVLGARLLPLEWGDWENAKLYGQASYAFAMKDVRYELGAEVRPFPYMDDDFEFKIGVSYRENTATNDIWKVNWVENSIAAMLFEYDFLDYYNVQGFSAYAIQRLSPYAQISAGYRSEEYGSLENEANWSLFGGRDFRFNPLVSEGQMNSVVVAFEGGQLSGLHSVPRGSAFRFDAEFGEGFGGDFDFSRFLGDVRFYVPFGYGSSLGFRFRGGYASDEAPIQKMFTLGGVGSVRAYPQNAFYGTRMLLGNVEYTIANISPLDDIFSDVQVFGFGDAGWVNNNGTNTFDIDDLLPAAGLGLSFADRAVRLELAWPLKEIGGEKDPTLWLRLSPTF